MHSQVTKAAEGNTKNGTEYSYTYDAGGNITEETVKTVKNGKTASTKKHTYTYAAKGWKDQLLSYDGKAITYDVMGRPVSYMGDAMSWTDTGLLQKVTGSGKSTLSLTAKSSAAFTYDADGARAKKSVITKGTDGKTAGTETVTYRYNNGLLLSEKRVTKTVKETGSSTVTETLRYYYDENGRVVRLGLVKTNSSGTETETGYFLLYNGQGDVVAIYRSSDGALMGTYEYDLWGKPVRTVKTEADTKDITDKNPIRYRSYYYDTETGLYYLNARYYDPSVRRFLNADSLAFMGGGDAVSYNLYAYCGNNPINRSDSTGQAWYHWAIGAAIVASCAVATVVTCGGFAAAATSVCLVGSGMACGSTASFIATELFIGSATAYGVAVMDASYSSIEEFNEQGDWWTVAETVGGGLLYGASAYVSIPAENRLRVETTVNSGYSKAPSMSKPNSIYEQLNSNGTVMSRTFYDANGNGFCRQDFTGRPHFDKITQQYLQQHEHIYLYNDKGLLIGKSIRPMPNGYTDLPTK